MKIIKSPSNNPVYNLALERFLLEEYLQDFLLLYINSDSVIIGRNQSAEAEADLLFCKNNNIPVLRRISGGGAVFHDMGNINYAFITTRTCLSVLDFNPYIQLIINSLEYMGIVTEIGKRGEILTDGLKISGTASFCSAKRQLFHGTLLHNTDLNKLQLALKGNHCLRGKRIASIPSPVTNLSFYPLLKGETNSFLEQLISFFLFYYNCTALTDVPFTFKSGG